jgi:hypothetical protein
LTAVQAGASIRSTVRNRAESQGSQLNEFGSGSRATFVSPYLRRPLRTLNKVLSERDEGDEDGARQGAANDEHVEGHSATWDRKRKSAVVSD